MCSAASSSHGLISQGGIGVWRVYILFAFLSPLNENAASFPPRSVAHALWRGERTLTRLVELKRRPESCGEAGLGVGGGVSRLFLQDPPERQPFPSARPFFTS